MSNVVFTVATRPQVFPKDTVEGLFHFEVAQLDGTVVQAGDSAEPTFTFADVAEGSYMGSVMKNDVLVVLGFEVGSDTVTFQVPDVLTIQVS